MGSHPGAEQSQFLEFEGLKKPKSCDISHGPSGPGPEGLLVGVLYRLGSGREPAGWQCDLGSTCSGQQLDRQLPGAGPLVLRPGGASMLGGAVVMGATWKRTCAAAIQSFRRDEEIGTVILLCHNRSVEDLAGKGWCKLDEVKRGTTGGPEQKSLFANKV